jgi:hypothetical protein
LVRETGTNTLVVVDSLSNHYEIYEKLTEAAGFQFAGAPNMLQSRILLQSSGIFEQKFKLFTSTGLMLVESTSSSDYFADLIGSDGIVRMELGGSNRPRVDLSNTLDYLNRPSKRPVQKPHLQTIVSRLTEFLETDDNQLKLEKFLHHQEPHKPLLEEELLLLATAFQILGGLKTGWEPHIEESLLSHSREQKLREQIRQKNEERTETIHNVLQSWLDQNKSIFMK